MALSWNRAVRGTLEAAIVVVETVVAGSQKGLRSGHADCTSRRFERIFAVKRFGEV
jgi:hypothetical protein